MSEIERCGFVALLGAPNAGKSTLTNALVGSKVSIVTPKVQTTRARITAIAMHGQAQVVFVDTPGIFNKTKQRLEKAMVAAAWSGAADADLRVLLVDAERGLDGNTRGIIDGLKKAKMRAVLVLNKIDLVRREVLLAMADNLDKEGIFSDIFMLSALNGDGVQDLLAALADQLPEGPWHYPEDQLADIPQRLLAAEITREKLFLQLHQELPYAATVETESWKTVRGGALRIEQVIYVRRGTQKAIVLGKGGQQIKQIGAEARAEMTEIFGCTVHLFLFVKVRDNWQDDPERYREMGLDFHR
ncbi:MAG: GTPase Era [Rhodospirillaceae bacterium]|jgi:GTPase|nr:GTPase Era [Rhodospirillaceae bacterium]MBT4489681.1 GTPase Era [Rhodospirillaceae bacterium]MBT5191953.1 GTPase Era [Rhodospirillaceae bacterium]MBT5896448.1 GTPase Era [Rhodospirillaceae bacterium]MBT6426943.1 GTPase Era [Rhodospirillaceae bacterium]